MVAVERVKEYSELTQEAAEFVEPRPPKEWPSRGTVECDHLSIRYAVSHSSFFRITSLLILRSLTCQMSSTTSPSKSARERRSESSVERGVGKVHSHCRSSASSKLLRGGSLWME